MLHPASELAWLFFGLNKGSSGRGIPVRPAHHFHMGPSQEWVRWGWVGIMSACITGVLGIWACPRIPDKSNGDCSMPSGNQIIVARSPSITTVLLQLPRKIGRYRQAFH
jgi:hypothetical protein